MAQFRHFLGTPGRIRTYDQLLRRQLLYPLSYGRVGTQGSGTRSQENRTVFLVRSHPLPKFSVRKASMQLRDQHWRALTVGIR
jgi:hypothetical protein